MFFVQKHNRDLINLEKVKTIELKQEDYSFFDHGTLTKLTLVADDNIILQKYPYRIKFGKNENFEDTLDTIYQNMYFFLGEPTVENFHNITDDLGKYNQEANKEINRFFKLLQTDLEDLYRDKKFPKKIYEALRLIDIYYVGQLVQKRRGDFSNIIAYKYIQEGYDSLKILGLRLGMKVPENYQDYECDDE